MASTTSVKSGSNIVYTITDVKGNTLTITAPPAPGGLTFVSSASGLLIDGQIELSRLILMLQTNLRPTVLSGSTDSFTN